MKIKMLKTEKIGEVDVLENSIATIDEVTGKSLVENKLAIEYTPEVEELEKQEALKMINELKEQELKEIKNMSIENKVQDEFVIGKMFQRMAKKSITGNSETSSAADGGNLVTTGISALQPLVLLGSQVYSKCRRIPVQANCNAMKVPYDNSSKFVKNSAPVVTNPAEGVAGTATKLVTGSRTLTLTKSQIPLYVTEELLEDSASTDAYIRSIITGKMSTILDYEILKGSAAGFTGVNGDTGFCATAAISATPTVAEIAKIVNMIHPQYQAGAEWYCSITDWNLYIGTFATSNNLFNQIIDVAGKKLMGKPVNVVPSLAAGDVILGDFSAYVIIEPPVTDMIQISNEVRFLEGEVVYKLTHRGAGAIIVPTQATGDSLTVSAFVEKA
jgi:HK97 family phage major capsid protein